MLFRLLGCDAAIEGTENMPQTAEPLLFVANHPLGGLDGMLIALMLHNLRDRQLKVVVTDFLMYMQPLRDLFVPVNKTGDQSLEYARRQLQMWESDADVLTFPAGACARKINGKVTELPWKKSFVLKARQYHRDIVPIRFEGRNSDFFYNLALWRKRLAIKTNIERLYLVDEMFRARGKQFKICIGKPITWQSLDNSRTPEQWAMLIRDGIETAWR